MAWTTDNSNTFWQSLRVRDTDVLLYIDIAFSSFRRDSDLLSLEIVRKFMSIQNKGTIFVRNGLSKQDRQDHFDSKGF